jgi:hypothetical protein
MPRPLDPFGGSGAWAPALAKVLMLGLLRPKLVGPALPIPWHDRQGMTEGAAHNAAPQNQRSFALASVLRELILDQAGTLAAATVGMTVGMTASCKHQLSWNGLAALAIDPWQEGLFP